MKIHLYNHRGDHVADTFEATLECVPSVGHIIVRRHPGYPDKPITLWHVVKVQHDFVSSPPVTHVFAWETKEEVVKETSRVVHEVHLYGKPTPDAPKTQVVK